MSRATAAAVLLLCAGAGLVPVLTLSHLPLQDYPQHLLIARALTGYDAVDTDWCLHFVRDLKLRPYLGYYGLAVLLEGWLDVDAVGRLTLAIYLVGTALGALWYTLELAPARAPAALLVVPCLWSGNYYYLGLLNFLLSLPALFAGLACLLRFTRSGSVRAATGFVLAGAVAYLCHVTTFGTLLLSAGVMGLMAPRCRRVPALALVGLLAVVAAVVTPFADFVPENLSAAYVAPETMVPDAGAGRGLIYLNPLQGGLYLLSQIVNDGTLLDGALWGIPVGALLVTLLYQRRELRLASPESPRPRPERFVLPVLSLLLLFVTPAAAGDVEMVNMRFTASLFLALPALVPARLLDRRNAGALVAFAIAVTALHVISHFRFDREARAFDPIVAAVRPGSTVLPLMFEARSPLYLATKPYLYFGHLVQYEKGGLGMEIFGGGHMPLKMRPEARTGMIRLRWQPWLVTARVVRVELDYIVTRGLRRADLIPAEFEPLVRSGDFVLFGRASREPR